MLCSNRHLLQNGFAAKHAEQGGDDVRMKLSKVSTKIENCTEALSTPLFANISFASGFLS
jgi:hypothetical protein